MRTRVIRYLERLGKGLFAEPGVHGDPEARIRNASIMAERECE